MSRSRGLGVRSRRRVALEGLRDGLFVGLLLASAGLLALVVLAVGSR